jgi:alpha-galactosidase
MTKVAFVGAGSVVFTRHLLGDILVFPELGSIQIALHDIDAERLDTAEAIARVTADELGARPQITSHLERAAALEDADYVLNMVQIGGHEATLVDFDVPERYGVSQTIADTLGIGGIFRALRTAPHMLALGDEMAELCGDAWLLNYTNPMAMLCWLVYEGTPTTRVVGLCHSVPYTVETLAGIVGVPADEITFLAAGINHQAFMLRLERHGEDLYPLLDEAIAADAELRRRVRVELYRRLGYFPTESSEHAAEYVPWIARHPAERERFRVPLREYVRRSEENLTEYAHVRDALARGETVPIERSVEYASLIIHSIETGQPRVVYGNVRNTGLLDALPDGCCVEVPCLVDATGLHPIGVPDYPVQLAALNRTFSNVVELAVRAVLDGRPEHVVHAAMLDPNTAATLTLDQIEALCAELVAAHGEAIPESLRRPALTGGGASIDTELRRNVA